MEVEMSSLQSIQPATFTLRTYPAVATHLLNFIDSQNFLHEPSHNHHPRLREMWAETIAQLRAELKKFQRLRFEPGWQENEQTQALEGRVKALADKLGRLRELNLYCGGLQKKEGYLEQDVEKFLFYRRVQELGMSAAEGILGETVANEALMGQYWKGHNGNIYTAEVINFLWFQQKLGLLQKAPSVNYSVSVNRDLLLLQRNNIIFRQLCDLHEKYTRLQQQLAHSYIALDFFVHDTTPQQTQRPPHEKEIAKKVEGLTEIARKIHMLQAKHLRRTTAPENTLLLPEDHQIFVSLSNEFHLTNLPQNEQYLSFLRGLFQDKLNEPTSSPQFCFLRAKIIRETTRLQLNRVLEALNIGSYIVSQTHTAPAKTSPLQFRFIAISEAVGYEVNQARAKLFSSIAVVPEALAILAKGMEVDGLKVVVDNRKILFPSALNNFLYFLKFMLSLAGGLQAKGLYSEQVMLQILEVKAEQLSQIAQASLTLLGLVRGRYLSSQMVGKYSKLLNRVSYPQILRKSELCKSLDEVVTLFGKGQRKASWLSQIAFELESGEEVGEVIGRLLEIEQYHSATFHIQEDCRFYQRLLHELIENRNNLKFQKCFSLPALHQLFAFCTAAPQFRVRLISQLAAESRTRLKLPQALRFFSAKRRLKLAVFRGELYWMGFASRAVKNKFLVNNSKRILSFRDFIQENARNLLNLSEKPLSYFLQAPDDFQRLVTLFSQEVQRLLLIETILRMLPVPNLEDHLSAFCHKQLQSFFNLLAKHNPIDDLFIHPEKRHQLLQLASPPNKLKFQDLSLDLVSAQLRHSLASLLFLIHSLSHPYTSSDAMTVLGLLEQPRPLQQHLPLHLLRGRKDLLKDYEDSTYLESQSLWDLILFYDYLLSLGVTFILETQELPVEDQWPLRQLLKNLQGQIGFGQLEEVRQQMRILSEVMGKSRSRLVCRVRSVLKSYQRLARQCRSEWDYRFEQSLCLLARVSSLTRRRIYNKVLQFRHHALGNHFNSGPAAKPSAFRPLASLLELRLFRDAGELLGRDIPSDLECVLKDLQQAGKEAVLEWEGEWNSGKKAEIVLFQQLRGWEVEVGLEEGEKRERLGRRGGGKKGVFAGYGNSKVKGGDVLQKLNRRVKVEFVRQSLGTRRAIYGLQIEEKRMRDEIAWETCKLQHNVIGKINKFIEESSLDQKQSLINFKYTVNLETIKGIQNVIHERTEIFQKQRNSQFITQPPEQSLLEINLKNIFAHVRKLRIFSAWKQVHREKDQRSDEWGRFAENVQRILHDQGAIKRLIKLQTVRKTCFTKGSLCQLIRQENGLLNASIQDNRLVSLQNRLKDFRVLHAIQ